MTLSAFPRARHLPAFVLGAVLASTSVVALAPAFGPADAYAAATGGHADLVARVAPGVVLIEVTRAAPTMAGINPAEMPQGFPFEEFSRRFGMPMPGIPGGPEAPGQELNGLGTGFIVKASGDIVTNSHVVEGADTVTVTLSDGTKLPATVVGADPATDLALIRVVPTGDLPTVAFGDSTALRVGEDVVAIGNPFGLGNSVTAGIVSALGRDINAGPFDNFIQTDAAINKGNSGGPLFNGAGQVVGVNTAIFSPSGGSVGIGFAVPAETAQKVIAELATDGKVDRGWLGVTIQPVSDDIAAALGLVSTNGALIADVSANSPAAKAGLKRGDVVLAVDGAKVADARELTRIVAGAAPGASVRLDLLRAGQAQGLTVLLGNRADQPA
ncbi:trypsin-like peptidase domain-containing protein [Paracoccaceae bacterium Fryx2]|nr:trypsin-like peptidase domain-containing protein [Paracoccaceae bacterium Fryx2]